MAASWGRRRIDAGQWVPMSPSMVSFTASVLVVPDNHTVDEGAEHDGRCGMASQGQRLCGNQINGFKTAVIDLLHGGTAI